MKASERTRYSALTSHAPEREVHAAQWRYVSLSLLTESARWWCRQWLTWVATDGRCNGGRSHHAQGAGDGEPSQRQVAGWRILTAELCNIIKQPHQLALVRVQYNNIYIYIYIYIYTYIHVILYNCLKTFLFPTKIWFCWKKVIYLLRTCFSIRNFNVSSKYIIRFVNRIFRFKILHVPRKLTIGSKI